MDKSKKIMNKMLLSCKKASELIEKKSGFKLSFIENLRLSIHSSMCDACSNYQKESIKLDSSLSKLMTENKKQDEQLLSPDFKAKLIKKLKG
jgi:hypothetical protein